MGRLASAHASRHRPQNQQLYFEGGIVDMKIEEIPKSASLSPPSR
jgi:hypothetical protein